MLNPNLKIDPVTQSPSHPKGEDSSFKPIVAVGAPWGEDSSPLG